GVHDERTVGQRTERAIGLAGAPTHHDAAFGGAVAVDHRDSEAFTESRDVALGSFVAQHLLQRVVAVVGARWCGEDVAERLAYVVEVRHAVPADVLAAPG